MNEKKIEICCFNLESAVNAQIGGADRIELCDNIHEGGTTPSYGMILKVRELLHIDINVLIRPRGGNFVYSENEFQIMKKNIIEAKKNGVNGIVTGLLNDDGSIDVKRTKQLVDLAYPVPVTFHRAFDVSSDPYKSLEDIIKTGAKRILTSGMEKTASEGIKLILQIIEKAQGRILIMPGAGITQKNIKEISDNTGASEFHSSAKVLKKKDLISFDKKSHILQHSYYISDSDEIKAIKRILDNS